MKKVYWKEVVKKDREQNFLKSVLKDEFIPLLEFTDELSIKLIDCSTNEKIEAYIPKKDIKEYLNNKTKVIENE